MLILSIDTIFHVQLIRYWLWGYHFTKKSLGDQLCFCLWQVQFQM